MKRRKAFLRTISASMAVIVTMGLTACTDGSKTGAGSNKDSKAVIDVKELTSKFFKESPIDLSKLYTDENMQLSVKSIKKINEQFYILAEKRVDDIMKEIAVLKIDPSNGEQNLVELAIPESDTATETYEYISCGLGDDGKIYAIKRISEGTNNENPDGLEIVGSDINASDIDMSEINDMIQNGTVQGNAVQIGDAADFKIKSQTLCRWNSDGTLIDEVELDKENSMDLMIGGVIPLKTGCIIMGYTNENFECLWAKVGEDGKVSDFKTLSDPVYDDGFFLNDKGQVCSIGYDSSYTHMGVKIYDENMELLEMKNFPDSFRYDGIINASFIGEDTVLFSGNGSLYTYHFGDAEANEIVNYVNSGLSMERMQHVFLNENGEFFASYIDVETSKYCFGEFKKADASEITTKELIRIGGFQYVNNEKNLKQKIVEFNAKNENYTLVYDDYSKYSTADDFMGGLTRLNNDIISGNAPDIFLTSGLDNLESLVSKGVLADIGEMMENDPEISQKEYMQNVFDAYKVDGKLYSLIPTFAVNTMVAKKSLVGDKATFTMQDMKDILDKMGEGAQAFYGVDNENFLRYALNFNESDLIDLKSGECHFDSQEFIDILEYANTLTKRQKDPDVFVFDQETMDDMAGQYRNNKTLLYDMSIIGFNDIKMELNGYLGEPVSYVGFPSENGKGACIYAMESYGISAKSKHKDVAWSFLRDLLLEDYQNKIPYGLPVLKSAFDTKSSEALDDKMRYLDENGLMQEYQDSLTINGENVAVRGLTQEQLDELVSYIESIDTVSHYDDAISSIVMEEVAPFFEGKKTAQEVAQIIQNRVSLLVKEQQ